MLVDTDVAVEALASTEDKERNKTKPWRREAQTTLTCQWRLPA